MIMFLTFPFRSWKKYKNYLLRSNGDESRYKGEKRIKEFEVGSFTGQWSPLATM